MGWEIGDGRVGEKVGWGIGTVGLGIGRVEDRGGRVRGRVGDREGLGIET